MIITLPRKDFERIAFLVQEQTKATAVTVGLFEETTNCILVNAALHYTSPIELKFRNEAEALVFRLKWL